MSIAFINLNASTAGSSIRHFVLICWRPGRLAIGTQPISLGQTQLVGYMPAILKQHVAPPIRLEHVFGPGFQPPLGDFDFLAGVLTPYAHGSLACIQRRHIPPWAATHPRLNNRTPDIHIV
jgi:hypothetical protein